MSLSERWAAVWSRLGARTGGETVFQALLQAYAEPHRHYHTDTWTSGGLQSEKHAAQAFVKE